MRVLVFDVGGTFIKYGMVEDGAMRSNGKMPTPAPHDAAADEQFLNAIGGVLARVREEGPVDGMAMSLPGTIDVERRHIHTGGSLFYTYGVDAAAWEERFGVPVEIENDARCAAIAEYEAGNLQGVRLGFVLVLGTGLGGSLVIDGEVYRGAHLYAGETSMIVMRPDSEREDPWTLDRADYAASLGTIGLVSAVAAACGRDGLDGEGAMALIEAKEPRACAAFDGYLAGLARTIHGIQCLVDPERICLGGGISQNAVFVDAVRDALARFNAADHLGFDFPTPEVMPCRFLSDANLVGAYHHFLRMRDARVRA